MGRRGGLFGVFFFWERGGERAGRGEGGGGGRGEGGVVVVVERGRLGEEEGRAN